MAFCGEASAWSKAALLLMLLALGLHGAGYGTNYWMTRYTVSDTVNVGVGLWRVSNCSGYYGAPCTEYDVPVNIHSRMQSTRSLEGIALGFTLIKTVSLVFYVGTERSRTRRMAVAIMLIAFIAVGSSVLGMIVWLARLPDPYYPNWSMGLTVFAFTLTFTSAILLISDILKYDYKEGFKMDGEFRNLSVTETVKVKKAHQEAEPVVEGETYLKPKIIPQHPLAAPSYQFMQYNTRKLYDGF